MLKKHSLILFVPFLITACDLTDFNITISDNDSDSRVDVQGSIDDNPNLPTPPEAPSPLVIPEGAKTVSVSDYSFTDDFEGTQDDSFWGGSSRGSKYSTFGAEDVNNANNKVLAITYHADNGNAAIGQQDFHLPKVTEMAFLYRLYTPSNYQNITGNEYHKLFLAWSGKYGIKYEGVHIDTEMATSSDGLGKTPTMAYGGNPLGTPDGGGDNRGHVTRLPGHQELVVEWEDGQWHDMYIYFKAAPAPGEYGSYEVWRDGVKLISTDDDRSIVGTSWWIENGNSPQELINYAEGLNYIDQGYFMGSWSSAGDGNGVTFQIDDLTVIAKKQ